MNVKSLFYASFLGAALILNGTPLLAENAEKKSSSKTTLESSSTKKAPKNQNLGEVLENPTLKTLSGSLSRWSFKSSFSYKGGSLKDPTNAERPTLDKDAQRPSLQSLSGGVAIKYRLSKNDNLSLGVGLHMITPFNKNHKSKYPRVQKHFDENHQKLNIDNPKLSYFRTFYIGPIQNVSFVDAELITIGVESDIGYHSRVSLSHSAAFRIFPGFYGAFTASYIHNFFNADDTLHPRFGRVSLKPFQKLRRYRLAFSTEYYFSKVLALRGTTGLFSYSQLRSQGYGERKKEDLKQTLALSYFVNRDISISPNIGFIISDLRRERSRLGVNLNISL